MLILTRRPGETLTIGDDVRITILGVKGAQIRVGIDAPKEVIVHREEVYQRIHRDRDIEHPTLEPMLAVGTDDASPASVVYLKSKS